MNKKILAATIAAAVAAPAAALANDVTIYGVVHASIDNRSEDSTSLKGVVYDRATGAYVNSINGVPVSTIPADLLVPAAFLVQQNLWNTWPGGKTDGWDIVSRATRLGFKGTEDLSNGLKAIWKMELQVDIADRGGGCPAAPMPNTASDANAPINSLGSPTLNQGNAAGNCDTAQFITARNAYVGLASGFGTFLVGRHDTPYKMSTGSLDLFADTLADYNSTVGLVDLRTNSAVAYVSPSWSGVTFSGAIVAPHIANDASVVAIPGVAGAPYTIYQKEADADGLAEAYSLALTFNANGFFASAAYENVSGTWWDAATNGGASPLRGYDWGGPLGLLGGVGADFYNSSDNSKYRFGLGWTGAGFTVGGVYENEDNILGVDGASGDRWQLQAGYTFGNNMIKVMYGQGNYDFSGGATRAIGGGVNQVRYVKTEADQDAWAIGLDHNFSKRTKAYVLYTAVDGNQKNSNQNYQTDTAGLITGAGTQIDYNYGGFSVGMIHSF
jgi:predicted porin